MLSKKTKALLSALICCVVFATSAFADIKLPEPKRDGGDGVLSLIERRSSGTRNAFPNGAISDAELSTILWAATGLNRGGKGWTVPLAGGKPPYVKIFAVRSDGAFLYDWKAHSLAEVTPENILDKITGDGFVRSAPCVLVFVSAPDDLGNMSNLNRSNELAYIASGAMAQNVYLAADALGVNGRYMVSMKVDAVKNELRLKASETPLCIMPLGKR
jgi:hypothetical protein